MTAMTTKRTKPRRRRPMTILTLTMNKSNHKKHAKRTNKSNNKNNSHNIIIVFHPYFGIRIERRKTKNKRQPSRPDDFCDDEKNETGGKKQSIFVGERTICHFAGSYDDLWLQHPSVDKRIIWAIRRCKQVRGEERAHHIWGWRIGDRIMNGDSDSNRGRVSWCKNRDTNYRLVIIFCG